MNSAFMSRTDLAKMFRTEFDISLKEAWDLTMLTYDIIKPVVTESGHRKAAEQRRGRLYLKRDEAERAMKEYVETGNLEMAQLCAQRIDQLNEAIYDFLKEI